MTDACSFDKLLIARNGVQHTQTVPICHHRKTEEEDCTPSHSQSQSSSQEIYIASAWSKLLGAYGITMDVASCLLPWSKAASLLALSKSPDCAVFTILEHERERSELQMPPAERSARRQTRKPRHTRYHPSCSYSHAPTLRSRVRGYHSTSSIQMEKRRRYLDR